MQASICASNLSRKLPLFDIVWSFDKVPTIFKKFTNFLKKFTKNLKKFTKNLKKFTKKLEKVHQKLEKIVQRWVTHLKNALDKALSSSLVNKEYIGDSFKYLTIMMQIFNFFGEPIFVICKVANLAYNKYRSIKKMKICFIVAIILKLLPMYFLLTKHEDFVLNHFFSSRIGQVTKYWKNYTGKVGHIYSDYRGIILRVK